MIKGEKLKCSDNSQTQRTFERLSSGQIPYLRDQKSYRRKQFRNGIGFMGELSRRQETQFFQPKGILF